MKPIFVLLNRLKGDDYSPAWINIGNTLYAELTSDGGTALHMVGGELLIVEEPIEDIISLTSKEEFRSRISTHPASICP